MKPRDLIVILSAAGLALVLLILSRSGLLQPKAAPKSQTAPDITVQKFEADAAADSARELSLWGEDSRRLPGSAYLRISVNNRMYEPIPLNGRFSVDIAREGGYHNLVSAEDGVISMIFSSCDNQLCVHQGEVSLDNRDLRALYNQIICLPNEVLLEVLNEQEVMSFYAEQPTQENALPDAFPLLWSLFCLGIMFMLRAAIRLPLVKRRSH